MVFLENRQTHRKDNLINEKAVHEVRQVKNYEQPFPVVCSRYKIKKNSFKNKVKL